MDNLPPTTVNLEAVKTYLEALGYGIYVLKSPCLTENKVDFEAIWQAQEEAVSQRALKGQLYGFEGVFEDFRESLAQFLKLQEAWVLLLPYALKSTHASSEMKSESTGKVSIMSWEWDYHEVMRQDIRQTAEAFGIPSAGYQLQVDSGPWPERRLAFLAGAGKIGRNQMILNDAFGGAFYLGILGWRKSEAFHYEDVPQPLEAVINDLNTSNEGILSTSCKTCQLCQKACPGNALVHSYEFLPMRCISALSQMKRALTESEKILLGNHLYGCDICQSVCPTNMSRQACQPRQRQTAPEMDVFELLEMSQRQFKATYGHHGFSWRGLKTLKRNALVCLGNTGGLSEIEFLHRLGKEKYFEGELESVRLWALSRIQERVEHD